MESLATPIHDTSSILDIHNDLALIDTINSKISQLEAFRQSNITLLETRINELKTQLENTQSSIRSLKSSTQSRTTKSDLKKLENDIFNSARNLTDLNMEVNTLKLLYNQNLKKLDQLETELNEIKLDYHTVDNTKTVEENANLIKLKLFKSSGVKFNDKTGEVLVLNKLKKNVSVLQIDESYSEYFISNYIWDNM